MSRGMSRGGMSRGMSRGGMSRGVVTTAHRILQQTVALLMICAAAPPCLSLLISYL